MNGSAIILKMRERRQGPKDAISGWALAERIHGVEEKYAAFVIALASIYKLARFLSIDESYIGLIEAALELLGVPTKGQTIIEAAKLATTIKCVNLAAMGLVNTLNHAKEEQDLERRNRLLDELRQLHRDHCEDAAVREKMAMGLFNTLIDAKKEGKDKKIRKSQESDKTC